MKIKSALTVLFFCTFLFSCFAADLTEFIGPDFQIFKTDRPRFITYKNKYYFAWTSGKKDTARYPVMKNGPKLTCFQLPVQEVLVRFKNESLVSIYISFYNRGDAGEITSAQMNSILKKIYQTVSRKMNLKPVYRKNRLTNAAIVHNMTWGGEKFTYTLTWSSTGKRTREMKPEYINLELGRSGSTAKTSVKQTVDQPKCELTENIRRDDRGNIWIEGIPMVDQGEKGYCAVAVLERVFRYYGCPVTQHTFAQLAGSSAQAGTSWDGMIRALEKTDSKFGVKVRQVYNIAPDMASLEKLVKSYNKLARRKKKKPVKLIIRGNTVYVSETMKQFDPELFIELRQSDKNALRSFSKMLHTRIENGMPIVWCVELGIVPEEKMNPQTKGGHVRLLIGYNDRTREVIYTDTWGIGHERKTMPIENAWVITHGLFNIDPRR